MKKLFTILFLILSLTVKATDYYVQQGGNDSRTPIQAQNPSTPWATGYHASTIAVSGDIVHFLVGTITETTEAVWSEGVSLIGLGVTSIIHSHITTDWNATYYFYSGAEGTNGNQTISNLKFTGGLTAWCAVYIAARSNVIIHDCIFEDFDDDAVVFNGKVDMGDPGAPTIYATGNKFYNNIVTNCCKLQVGDWMSGALCIGGQDGIEIYGNTLTETARGAGNCGYPIKLWNDGYIKGIKIHNNNIVKLPSTSNWNDWNFAIELWNYQGGIEIYDNVIEGSIDIDHVIKGSYDYGCDIHNNTFGYSTLPPSSGDWSNLSAGVYIEFACNDVIIRNNLFKNLESPFRFSPRDETSDGIYIYDNIISQIGNTGNDAGCNLMNFSGSGFTIDNLWFVNNTIYAGTNNAQYGMIIPGDEFNYLTIRNNIFYGFETRPIEITGTNKDYLYIQNNIFYGNGTNSANVTGSPSHYTNSNNLTGNPTFVILGSDYHLQAGSPAIGTGIDVSLATDYEGNTWSNPPSIGAYEYGSEPPLPPPPPVTGRGFVRMNGKIVMLRSKMVRIN